MIDMGAEGRPFASRWDQLCCETHVPEPPLEQAESTSLFACVLCPRLLPYSSSPKSISVLNHLHRNPHLRFCFSEPDLRQYSLQMRLRVPRASGKCWASVPRWGEATEQEPSHANECCSNSYPPKEDFLTAGYIAAPFRGALQFKAHQHLLCSSFRSSLGHDLKKQGHYEARYQTPQLPPCSQAGTLEAQEVSGKFKKCIWGDMAKLSLVSDSIRNSDLVGERMLTTSARHLVTTRGYMKRF